MDPEILERLIEQGRDGYEARLAAGQAWLKRDQVERALTHLIKATQMGPERTMAWQELGRAHRIAGQSDQARSAWQTGMEVAGNNGDKQAEKVMGVWLKRLGPDDS